MSAGAGVHRARTWDFYVRELYRLADRTLRLAVPVGLKPRPDVQSEGQDEIAQGVTAEYSQELAGLRKLRARLAFLVMP